MGIKRMLALLLVLMLGAVALAEDGWNYDSEPALDVEVEGVRVYASRAYNSDLDREVMTVTCSEADGGVLWTEKLESAQKQGFGTEAFIGGTADVPEVLLYSQDVGLASVELRTGEVRWKLPRETVDLGESISWAVAADATLYIGGSFGPDPVAIDAEGHVLWQAHSGSDDIFWLDRIQLGDAGIAAHYDHIADRDGDPVPGWLLFGPDGTLLDQREDG